MGSALFATQVRGFSQAEELQPVISTFAGRVRGRTHRNVSVFLGIPTAPTRARGVFSPRFLLPHGTACAMHSRGAIVLHSSSAIWMADLIAKRHCRWAMSKAIVFHRMKLLSVKIVCT
jgi:hypothetical protein